MRNDFRAPLERYLRNGAIPLGLMGVIGATPRATRSSQPWADGLNPVAMGRSVELIFGRGFEQAEAQKPAVILLELPATEDPGPNVMVIRAPASLFAPTSEREEPGEGGVRAWRRVAGHTPTAHPILSRGFAVVALAVALFFPACASPQHSAKSTVDGVPRLHSIKELRDRNVVKQQFDYSCGAASLATLLRFYFGDRVSERVLLLDMLQTLPVAEREDRVAHGFTLLDLQNAAIRRGYQAEGVSLELPALTQLGGPVLLHMVIQGQRHFVIFRGVAGDRIFLADPNRGNVRMNIWQFSQRWTGVALALGRGGAEPSPGHALAVRAGEVQYPETQSARGSLYQP